jgi:Xaa-Pro aminopeptidase
MRMVKQPREVEAIQQAIEHYRSSRLIKLQTKNKLKKYQYEYQLEAEITKNFRVNGAQGHAFRSDYC